MNSVIYRASKIFLCRSQHTGSIIGKKSRSQIINCTPSIRRFHPSTQRSNTVKITYVDSLEDEKTVDAEVGKNLLDIAHDHDIELEGACGGGELSKYNVFSSDIFTIFFLITIFHSKSWHVLLVI